MTTINITEELLLLIERRVEQYAICKYGNKPDHIFLSAGSLMVRYDDYCCGSYEYKDFDVTVENLTEDLDALSAERIQKEKEQREKQEKENEERRKELEKRKIREDKELFLKLKKRFEP